MAEKPIQLSGTGVPRPLGGIQADQSAKTSSKAPPVPILPHKRGSAKEFNEKQRWTDHYRQYKLGYIMDNDDYVIQDDFFLLDTIGDYTI